MHDFLCKHMRLRSLFRFFISASSGSGKEIAALKKIEEYDHKNCEITYVQFLACITEGIHEPIGLMYSYNKAQNLLLVCFKALSGVLAEFRDVLYTDHACAIPI